MTLKALFGSTIASLRLARAQQRERGDMAGTNVICRFCGAGAAMRVSRAGLLQRKVLSRLGIFPWKCGACGSLFLFPSRGHGPRSRTVLPESPSSGSTPAAAKPHLVPRPAKPRA